MSRPKTPPWTLQDVGFLMGLEAALVLLVLGVAGVFLGEGGRFESRFSESQITSVFYALQTMVLLVPLYLFTWRKYGNTLQDFGFAKVGLKTLFKRVAQGFLIFYVASSFLLHFSINYKVDVPGFGDQESHVPLFGEALSGLILGGIIIVIIAPLVEEIFFRGYLYQVFKKYVSTGWASVFAAVVFAFFHLEFAVFIPLFILGMVLNWIFEISRSLWAPIAFHMINNALAFSIEIAIYFEWIDLPELL